MQNNGITQKNRKDIGLKWKKMESYFINSKNAALINWFICICDSNELKRKKKEKESINSTASLDDEISNRLLNSQFQSWILMNNIPFFHLMLRVSVLTWSSRRIFLKNASKNLLFCLSLKILIEILFKNKEQFLPILIYLHHFSA